MEKWPAGTAHTELPKDLRLALEGKRELYDKWCSLTPLARNEWICWAMEAKQAQTRERRISRTVVELSEGKRRPCCWIGCVHRADKAVSPSVKGILAKRSKR